MKKIILALLMLCAVNSFCQRKIQPAYNVKSPDSKINLHVRIRENIAYTISYAGSVVVDTSIISLRLSDRILGLRPRIKKVSPSKHKGTIALPYGNTKEIHDEYNELTISFDSAYSLVLRVYNEGAAYRFVTDIKGQVKVLGEEATFNVPKEAAVKFPQTDNFTSWELPYVSYESVASIPEGKRAITPTLFTAKNLSIIIAESDVLDYPGMYLTKAHGTIKGSWAKYPKTVQLGSWGDFVSIVKETENFIALTNGSRPFPWRIVMVSASDRSILTNTLVFKLAKPLAIDASWIRPGKATWEWWHDAIVEDAGIPSGMDNRNTALYKHYIDFASANKLEYLMLDAGWSDNHDMSKIKPKNDIGELVRYGKSKNVDIFLWCVATTLLKDIDKNMDMLKDWGVAGLKVDFIDRDDQVAISWFETIASAAAKRKLMVNFHGCSKPTGLERAYPNIVNYEAVRGAESSKWDRTIDPDHHVNLLFTRMVAGPMDYTPGSMRNRTKELFRPIDPGLPLTQGTRCHELSMFVLFYQPFAMLCDAPAEYRKYPDIMKFLQAVPTSFDETIAIDAKAGEFAVVAKRKGNDWFIGAMTNWTGRTVTIDFSFLPRHKKFTADLYTDRKDANTQADQYDHKEIPIDNSTRLTIELAKGGGAAMLLRGQN